MNAALAWLQGPPPAAATALPAWVDKVLPWALAAFGFFLPFSVAGTSVMLLVLLVLAIAAVRPLVALRPWREPAVLLGLALIGYIGVHTLAVDGWTSQAASAIRQYKELLLAPALFALFLACRRREFFFRGLVAGAAAYAVVHWVALGWHHLSMVLAPHYISAGFIFAVLAFLLLERALASARPWAAATGAAFFALTALFALQGRTGQLVLLVLLSWLAWMRSPGRLRVWAVLGVVLAILALALSSPRVQHRLAETRAALAAAPEPPFSSTEIRLELVRHGWTLARENLPLGGGYTRYSELHQDVVRRAYQGDPLRGHLADASWARTENPHSEFVMQLVGGGLPGLALFMAWLVAPALRRDSAGSRSPELVGVVVAFAIACLFNSMLMDFVVGHFHAALLAWLLARQAER